jgi:3-dehydroquinate dehydratase/shikimate dehydrogenase
LAAQPPDRANSVSLIFSIQFPVEDSLGAGAGQGQREHALPRPSPAGKAIVFRVPEGGQTTQGPIVIASVVERSPASIAGAIARAARLGADRVEVRLDAGGGIDPEAIPADTAIPLIATCRAVRDGGAFEGSEDERVNLLARAARTGRFRLDVELGSGAFRLQGEHPGWIAVVSHHDGAGTPSDLEGIAGRLLGSLRTGQIAKLVTTATRLTDCLVVRDLLAKLRDPRLAAFAMGGAGAASRVLCGAWGSAAIWAGADARLPAAPGQIDLVSLLGRYRFRALTAATRVYGVAGSSVAGSRSPAIHNAAYAELGYDGVYVPLECAAADELAAFARGLPLAGVSITTPLKESVVPLLDGMDAFVRETGACNTWVGGRGFNTDGRAAREEIEERVDPAGRPALVVGAGGAARAVAFALARAGARVTIATRAGSSGGAREEAGGTDGGQSLSRAGSAPTIMTQAPDSRTGRGGAGGVGGCEAPADEIRGVRSRERGEALARELGARHCRIEDLAADPQAVIVQATSAPLEDPVVPSRALGAAFVLDLRYAPLGSTRISALCEAARRLGVPTADGLGMLVRQARAQIILFTGREVPLDVLMQAAKSGGYDPSL